MVRVGRHVTVSLLLVPVLGASIVQVSSASPALADPSLRAQSSRPHGDTDESRTLSSTGHDTATVPASELLVPPGMDALPPTSETTPHTPRTPETPDTSRWQWTFDPQTGLLVAPPAARPVHHRTRSRFARTSGPVYNPDTGLIIPAFVFELEHEALADNHRTRVHSSRKRP